MEAVRLLNRFGAVFVISFGLLIFFLTPDVNTGDAGELITASFFLGIAHPSGYPLYLLIAKAFSFLPFGTVGFKVALVSAVFSALSLSILYLLAFRLTESDLAALAVCGFLVSSHSYLTQSVIAKFYTLNLFLILLLFAIWFLQLLLSGKERKPDETANAYKLTFLLFGLILSNHNTGILIAAPVALAIWMLRKEIFVSADNFATGRRYVLIPAALFLMGFAVNAYLFVRGGDDRPFNVFHVRNMTEFYLMLTRQVYGDIGTLSKAGSLFSSPLSFWYGLRNFVAILAENFGSFSFALFFAGCYFMYRKNIRILLFVLSSLAVYGPLFTKIALPGPEISLMESYVYAHQYYLPAFAFYAFGAGAGLLQIAIWCRIDRNDYKLRIFGVAVASLFMLLIFFRSTDSNFRTNHVPYQAMVDTYAMMPPNSVFLAFHDNEKYPGRYLKLIGRYREDICHINGVLFQHNLAGVNGCRNYSYSNISPEMFPAEMALLKPLMADGRLWSGSPGALAFPVEVYFYPAQLSLSYLYLPRQWGDVRHEENRAHVRNLVRRSMPVSEKVVHSDVCRGLSSEDLLTNYLCDKYVRHMIQLTNYYMSPDELSVNQGNAATADDSGLKSPELAR